MSNCALCGGPMKPDWSVRDGIGYVCSEACRGAHGVEAPHQAQARAFRAAPVKLRCYNAVAIAGRTGAGLREVDRRSEEVRKLADALALIADLRRAFDEQKRRTRAAEEGARLAEGRLSADQFIAHLAALRP